MEHTDFEFFLFYTYFKYENSDFEELIINQRILCNSLNMKGRVRISKEGMNGILSGTTSAISAYQSAIVETYIDCVMNWYRSGFVSRIPTEVQHFTTLSVKATKEVVSLDLSEEKLSIVLRIGSGEYVDPDEFHNILEEIESGNGSDLRLIDIRNQYEVRIGTFKGDNFAAINPETRQFSDIVRYFDEHINEFRNKKVVMYCTGGVRCERASAYLKYKGVTDVYHLKGGIHAYQTRYGASNKSYFQGKNFVFDPRLAISNEEATSCTSSATAYVPAISSSESSIAGNKCDGAPLPTISRVIGQCTVCQISCDDYSNQARCPKCRMLILMCTSCLSLLNEVQNETTPLCEICSKKL